ncbi:MAG TPA: hypothetical protein VD994_04045, partial [Prosthecobacter sp.]|nr:hypothetical protein [Prosthecobacter sp.]
KLAAAGITLDFASFLPAGAEIPDDQNVAAAEPYIRLRSDNSVPPPPLGFEDTLKQFAAAHPGRSASATPPDFGRDHPSAPPLSPDPPTAARQVLDHLSVHDPLLAQIRAACARPRIGFDLQWKSGSDVKTPQLAWIISTTKLLRLRCTALITLHRNAEALADLKLLLRQAEMVRIPNLIGLLVEQTIVSETISHVWHGLATGLWTDAQLRELDSLYRGFNPARAVEVAIQAEHAMMQDILSFYAENRRKGNKEIASVLTWATHNPRIVPEHWNEQRVKLTANLIPTGWIRQNQAGYAANVLNTLRDLRAGTSMPGTFKPSRLPALPASSGGIYTVLLDSLSSPHAGVLNLQRGFAARLALARTAIALEQHRRATGALPATLAELKSPPPPDPITGAPLYYQRLDDGKRFKLWSVALNGTDDGGIAKDYRSSSPDWVWLSWIEAPEPPAR